MVEEQNIIFNNIRKFFNVANKDFDIERILLFGSYSRGTANEFSDIDVAVILMNRGEYSRISIMKRLFLIASKIDNRIEPKCIFSDEVDTAEPASILAEILRTGIEVKIK